MTGPVTETANMAPFATPEVRSVFEEWAKIVEDEIVVCIKKDLKMRPAAIAEKVKLSEQSVLFFVSKLLREGRLMVEEFRVAE